MSYEILKKLEELKTESSLLSEVLTRLESIEKLLEKIVIVLESDCTQNYRDSTWRVSFTTLINSPLQKYLMYLTPDRVPHLN